MSWINYLHDNKELIETLSSIATPLGTISAVMVSLYLSYRGNHPLYNIKADADWCVYHAYNAPPEYAGTPIVGIDIKNFSIQPVEINSFGWIIGFNRRFLQKGVKMQMPNELVPSISQKLPTLIPFGQNATYAIIEDSFLKDISPHFIPLRGLFSFLNKPKLFFSYIFIKDSLDNFYYFRLGRRLRNKILDCARNLNNH